MRHMQQENRDTTAAGSGYRSAFKQESNLPSLRTWTKSNSNLAPHLTGSDAQDTPARTMLPPPGNTPSPASVQCQPWVKVEPQAAWKKLFPTPPESPAQTTLQPLPIRAHQLQLLHRASCSPACSLACCLRSSGSRAWTVLTRACSIPSMAMTPSMVWKEEPARVHRLQSRKPAIFF